MEWDDTTPIELRVERIRGAVREIGRDMSSLAEKTSDGIARVEQRLEHQESVLTRVDNYVTGQKGADGVRRSVTGWIQPVMTVLLAGLLGWSAVTIWTSRPATAPAASDVAAEVVRQLDRSRPAAPAPVSPAP